MPTSYRPPRENPLNDPSQAAQLLAACPDPLVLADGRGMIQYANGAAAQMAGYDYQELLGLNLARLVPREMRRWLKQTAEQVDQLNKVSDRSGKIQRQDGTVLPVEVSVSKVDADQGPVYMIIARETSDRVDLTQEALHAERLRALGEIASGVAHDFRNTLAAILGRAQLLLMKCSDPEMHDALQTIEKAALDGGETVKRIMRYGAREGHDDELVPIDLNELLTEVIDATRYRWSDEPQREGKCIELEKRLTPLPRIEGSPGELRQFFSNLIGNACDAMPDGGKITVTTQSSPTTVTVTIADTGQGMPLEVQERIFDSFFTTKGRESLGLGLALGKKSVQRHGGQITVNSSAGEGSIFTVTLPRTEQVALLESETPAPPATDHPAQVLVVDDEPMLCELLRESIVNLGHEASVASCGEEAFQLLNLNHFDVVITDLGMPGIPGSRVAQAAKQASRQTYVILLTGWDDPLNPAQSRYVDRVLTKPTSVADLGAAIASGLTVVNAAV